MHLTDGGNGVAMMEDLKGQVRISHYLKDAKRGLQSFAKWYFDLKYGLNLGL